jgi:hypothetical protein
MPDDYFYVNGEYDIAVHLILHAEILLSDCQICSPATKDCP